MVERRLKGLALNTGLLLISIEASLPQALEDVTRRKVLYAIILTTQNEVHRSVTLNILHGSPQGKFPNLASISKLYDPNTFLSLDSSQWLAVLGGKAKRVFCLAEIFKSRSNFSSFG